MKKNSKGWAVVTGATSGIGLEFVRQLANDGYSLLIVARRRKRLFYIQKQLRDAGITCDVLIADLTTESGREVLFDWMKVNPVEVFINNAGFGLAGEFISTDVAREQAMIDLNITAVHLLMKEVLKTMVERDHGAVLNVASSAGLLPAGPYLSTYYATKAYVTSLTQAVAEELRRKGSKIYVGCLCPGPVDTEFNQVAEVQFALKGITPKKAVSTALHGMKRRKTVIVPSLTIKAGVLAGRLLPRKVAVSFAARQQMKKLQDENVNA